MGQQGVLDHPRAALYYGLLVGAATVLSACARGPAPLAPAVLPSLAATRVADWVRDLTPQGPRRYDLRWTFQSQKGAVRGRAAIRFVPPDSLRFDYRAPFGRSGAAVIIADSVQWVEPPDEIDALVEVAPLFWAAMGVPRPPLPGATITGVAGDAQRVWRYASPPDTLTYLEERGGPRKLRMHMRHAGRLLGYVEAQLDDNGAPRESAMRFPASATMFVIAVDSVTPLPEVDPEIWRAP